MTIFDKILSGEIPTDFIYEDEWVVAFHDINPQAPTHVLVIPKKKVVNFENLKNATPDDVGNFMQSVARAASHLGLDANGYRVVFNNGADAQMSVEYLHAHILGGRALNWPPG